MCAVPSWLFSSACSSSSSSYYYYFTVVQTENLPPTKPTFRFPILLPAIPSYLLQLRDSTMYPKHRQNFASLPSQKSQSLSSLYFFRICISFSSSFTTLLLSYIFSIKRLRMVVSSKEHLEAQ
jgi:hypothetical protein